MYDELSTTSNLLALAALYVDALSMYDCWGKKYY
jgi:hypothetical protein